MEKAKRILHKLYLTVQAFVALVGVGFLLFHIVAGFHDVWISQRAFECFKSSVGSPKFDALLEAYPKEKWSQAARLYSRDVDHPAKVYQMQKTLEAKCGEYLHASVYDYDKLEVGVYPNNYFEGTPATISERSGYLAASAGISLFLMALLYGFMRWLRWMSK